MTGDDDKLLTRLKVDKEGLIRQGNELRRDISELQRRLMMVKGALQYVCQILKQEEANRLKTGGSQWPRKDR